MITFLKVHQKKFLKNQTFAKCSIQNGETLQEEARNFASLKDKHFRIYNTAVCMCDSHTKSLQDGSNTSDFLPPMKYEA